jgi:hypothetical protein
LEAEASPKQFQEGDELKRLHVASEEKVNNPK